MTENTIMNDQMMNEIPIVRFQIGQVNFGIDVYQIADIIRVDRITRVPNSPDYIIGVLNLRGKIIPIINLRKRLSFDNVAYSDNCRILIVEFGEELAGLMVDAVYEVMMLQSYNIEPRPRYLVNNVDANYLIGLGLNENHTILEGQAKKNSYSEFILLLDLPKILNISDKSIDSEIKKIVEYKTKLLEEERKKLKKEIMALKDRQKTEIKSEISSKITENIRKSTDDTFIQKQKEIIEKIRKSRESSTKLNIKSKPNASKLELPTDEISTFDLNKGTLKSVENKSPKKIKKIVVRKGAKENPKNQFGKLNLREKELKDGKESKVNEDRLKNMTEMELSLIQEIGNIGAGNAATALSQMIDKRVNISVPTVEIVPTEKIPKVLGGADSLAISIYLAVEGDVSMYMMLVFNKPSGLRLADMLLFQERSDEELNNSDPLGQMDESALMEVGNILGSHYLTALSEFTNLHMIPGPPALTFDMLGSIIDFVQIELEEQVDTALILNTDILIEKLKIEGYILLLPIPETITQMLKEMGL